MAQLYSNNARSTLVGAILSTATSLEVVTGDATKYPAPAAGDFFDLTLQDATNIEIVRITARVGGVMTIGTRALEGTTANAFAVGTVAGLRLTAAVTATAMNHIPLAVGAHAASAISNAPSGNIAATTVQAAINELQSDVDTIYTQVAGKQPLDAELTTLAGITAQQATDLASVSTFIGTLLNDVDGASAQTTLGIGSRDITMTGNAAIEGSRAGIVQSATLMDFWAGPNIQDGTGVALTITGCVNAPQAGVRRKYYPLVGTVLAHGATFDIDGNLNQTAAAGDCWEVVAKTVSTYKVHVTKGNGTPVVISVPSGSISMFGAAAAPANWLLCDGAAVSRTTYVALFAAIGTLWGAGDGTTTFNTPDLRGRAPVGSGVGTGLTARTLATSGGAETHVLTQAELPTNAAHGGGGVALLYGSAASNSSWGGGLAHNNMQPFAIVNFIIKT